ncbi:MAG: hypothetical protein U0166_01175 [Acidobacteriota bacterium]
MPHSNIRRVLSSGLFLIAVASSRAEAGDLLVMAGNEPLKSMINESKESVRLLFLGSPT